MGTDQDFLRQAVRVGNQKAEPYNFGVVIVKDGEILAEGVEHVFEQNDPSAHDGISAFREASKKLGNYKLEGCTMYCSHEPCVMCFSAAIWAGIERVVYVTPKSADFPYEYDGVGLEYLAERATKPIRLERLEI